MTDTTASTLSGVFVFEDSDDSHGGGGGGGGGDSPSPITIRELPRVICVRPDPNPYAQLFVRYVDGAKPEVFATMLPLGYPLDEFPDALVPDNADDIRSTATFTVTWERSPSASRTDADDYRFGSSFVTSPPTSGSSSSSVSSDNIQVPSQLKSLDDDNAAKGQALLFGDQNPFAHWHSLGDANVWLLGDHQGALQHDLRPPVIPDPSSCGCLLVRIPQKRQRRFRITRPDGKKSAHFSSRPKPKGLSGKLQYSNLA